MKKKVMLLMLVLPLLFMLTIFSVTKAVSIIVGIPVSGISITTQNDEGFIALDMATYAEDLYITAEVSPYNASNKNYTVRTSNADGEDAPCVEVLDDGLLKINGLGRAKVTVTSGENAFEDSVVVNVTSSKVVDFTPAVSDAAGNALALTPSLEEGIDYVADITSGALDFSASVYPDNLSESAVIWASLSESVTVNEVTGKGLALLSGSTIITATNAFGVDGDIVKKIKLNVSPRESASGILINGVENGALLCDKNAISATVLGEKTTVGEITVSGSGVQDYTLEYLDAARTKFRLTLSFAEGHGDSVPVDIGCGGEANTLTVSFADYAFDVYTPYHLSTDDKVYLKNGKSVSFVSYSDTELSGITFNWSVSNPDVLSLEKSVGTSVKISGLKTGVSFLYVTAEKDNTVIAETVKSVTVIEPVLSVEFSESAKTYGISGILAVGSRKIDNGSYVTDRYTLTPKLLKNGNVFTPYDGSNVIVFESSDTSAATIFSTQTQRKINVVSTGKTTVTAKWLYSDYFGERVQASLPVRTVSEGVNVSTYPDLKKATDDGKAVVLNANIMLGRKGASVAELRSFASEMPTTYDWQYYENCGLARPNVLYLIEFKNDVYGNGFEINGDYVTRAVDSTGLSLLFKGPLDFVNAENMAAVKGQDNVVFLARTAGVTIDNVILKGCSDNSLINEDGDFDLSLLNFTGTTLEIAADVTVKNCRVNNGRTVMRVFGGKTNALGKSVVSDVSQVNAADERINVKIESCIVTSAREFLLKIGSNRALLSTGSGNTFAQSRLTDANGNAYNPFDALNFDDEYFIEKYLTTDVTLKNSVLATSGLFSIGLETHFSGRMLDGSGIALQHWTQLAATSYASILRLEGDVRLLDWKRLENVDSSTLVELSEGATESYDFLRMDIAAMLDTVAAKPNYKDIVSVIDNNKYVHGGIAAYGGGYNYSYVDTSKMTTEKLKEYRVNLRIFEEEYSHDTSNPLYRQGSLLPLAAGDADFRFYMYDGTSVTNYEKQASELSSGEAYKIKSAN